MSEQQPVPVEIVEPVVVQNGGQRQQQQGRGLVGIGYVLLALGISLGLYFGFKNDVKLNHEIEARCRVSEQSRAVLRKEHTAKLVLAQRRLDDALQFRQGRPIPPGFTMKDVNRSIANAQDDIRIEHNLLRDVQPVPCK